MAAGFLGSLDPHRRRSFSALLFALGVDNFGSGLFLPLTLVYITRVADVSVGVAGPVVGIASAVGLVVPAWASHVVDRVGARALVIASQLAQALGMVAFLVADGLPLVAVGAFISVAGLQLFYSCLNALAIDVVGDGPKDHPFALITRVRGACFGAGALIGSGLASLSDPQWMRVSVAANIVTFLAAAAVLAVVVHTRAPRPNAERAESARVPVWRNRPFVLLMLVTVLTGVPLDFFLSGYPVYVTESLRVDAWAIGFSVVLLTLVTATLGTLAVRLTDRFRRTTTELLGDAFMLVWAGLALAAFYAPDASLLPIVVALAFVLAAGNVIRMARMAAMAEATAPVVHKGHYLAIFQYSYSVPHVVAPTITGLFAIAIWVPWIVLVILTAVGMVLLRYAERVLPERALFVHDRDPVLAE